MPAPLEQLVEKLRKALDGDLTSVVLYGSAAVGDQDESYSDYNVLCTLREITPKQLAATETVFRWWREQGNPSPLLLTETELRTSTDCFPIEFHDIREHNRILFGPDLVSGLEIDRTFYRAQVEHDLRAKLLRLRQKASGILSDSEVLLRLLADSISTFCVLMRHALILTGDGKPGRKRDVIERAREQLGIDAAPFLKLLDVREGRVKAKEVSPGPLLEAYMREIEKVIAAVDGLDGAHTQAMGEIG